MDQPSDTSRKAEAFAEAVAIMARLRSPDGCPWDREQTFDSIKRHTLEETYEVFDAIDRRAWPELKDELGDLLLQVLFYARMAEEAGYFSIEDVARGLSAKLLRRHPHVFGEAIAHTAAEVNRTWEAVKQSEKARPVDARYLDEVSRHMPAPIEAWKLGQRAAKVGFDWQNVHEVFGKLEEETKELADEVARSDADPDAIEDELGDLLFTVISVARHLQVEPEFALRKANAKFRARFTQMEAAAGGIEPIRNASLEELDRMWNAAKLALSTVPAHAPDRASPAASEPRPDSSSALPR
jgi:XTP/dITP diphosphohydrolase/ATP diphosphatase